MSWILTTIGRSFGKLLEMPRCQDTDTSIFSKHPDEMYRTLF